MPPGTYPNISATAFSSGRLFANLFVTGRPIPSNVRRHIPEANSSRPLPFPRQTGSTITRTSRTASIHTTSAPLEPQHPATGVYGGSHPASHRCKGLSLQGRFAPRYHYCHRTTSRISLQMSCERPDLVGGQHRSPSGTKSASSEDPTVRKQILFDSVLYMPKT